MNDSETLAAVRVAVEKLGELGTPDAIAEFLAAEGIRGRRGYGASCPLAVYLSRVAEMPVMVAEFDWYVDVDGGRFARFGGANPYSVAEFIEAFDQFGRYPELVHEDEDA